MIIDFEHHYYPEELVRKHGGRPGEAVVWYEKGIPRITLHDTLYRIDDHLKAMDEAGIDVAVLTSWDHPLDECKIINNSLARLMKEYPDRIVGLAHVSPLDGETAFAELDRAIKELGLRGVVITAQVQGRPLDSKELWGFYEKVNELGVPIHVHPSTAVLGFEALAAPYDLYRTVGREFDLAAATTRLMVGGVLEDFPGLKFVISHLGGGISAILERIRWLESGPYRAGTRLTKPLREYFDKIYFNLAGFTGGMNAVRCALTTMSPHRMVFATDYPQNFKGDVEGMRRYVESIKALDLDEGSKERILGKTAAELLGLWRLAER